MAGNNPALRYKKGAYERGNLRRRFGGVVYGKAPLEYRDAGILFQKTYLTQGLKNLLDNVLSHLNGGKGDPVIQLQAPFGGGKIHALLALYHAVENIDKVKHLDVLSKLPKPNTVITKLSTDLKFLLSISVS